MYLGIGTQRECKSNDNMIDEYRKMFASRISAGAIEKLPAWEKPHAKKVACSYDMEGHPKTFVGRYCELANKKTDQLYEVSTPCLDDHDFKKEELETVAELSNVCSQNVLKCLYMARIGCPGHSLVRKQTCSSCHKLDSGQWQTLGSFDLLHPSHE